MAVDVLLQDEQQNILEHSPYPWAVPERLLPDYEDTSFPMLRFIDPYGDTVFNQLQMAEFLPEWRRLRPQAKTPGEIDFLEQVEKLAERCQNEPGLYLKFIGD